jgi:polyisoprenoid-binding protein YceI
MNSKTSRGMLVVLGVSTLFCLCPRTAPAAEYVVAAGDKHNEVVFESTAPLETFQGKTREVSGFATLDPSSLADSVVIEVSADMASLDTGIAMRNKHMRENHLETKKYPRAVFRGGRILQASATALGSGDPVTLELRGTMELHGVTRQLVVPVTAAMDDGGRLKIRAAFDVPLADYNIDRPRFLMLKLNEVQKVTVDLVLVPKNTPNN